MCAKGHAHTAALRPVFANPSAAGKRWIYRDDACAQPQWPSIQDQPPPGCCTHWPGIQWLAVTGGTTY
jgi:hypothetical protein